MSSENHTIPHRDTVASVAYFKVSTSNMILTFDGIWSLSPDGKVSSLLSSNTELRFSAHSGSTSPSKIIQWRFYDSPLWLSMTLLRVCVNTPSVHSAVVESSLP